MIAASLAIKIYKPPINSINEILDSPYNLIVANGTSVHDMFRNAPENSTYRQIADSGKLTLVKNEPIGLQTIINGKSRENYRKNWPNLSQN